MSRMAVLEEGLAEQARRLAEYEQRVAELEARLRTNSTNSSLPPSANPPAAAEPPAKPPSGRHPGGQPGHPGHGRPRLPADELVQHVPAQCERCHTPLAADPGPADPPPTWHQVLEVPEVLVQVTEHQVHGRRCAACGQVTWGALPAEVRAHGYGPHLTALIAFFSGRCHASKRTIEEILETVFGVPLSLGSVAHAEEEVSAALEKPYTAAEAAVQEAPVKNVTRRGGRWRGSCAACGWRWPGSGG